VEGLEQRAFFAAGSLDPSFGQNGQLAVQFGGEVITVVRDRAIQPDGKIVLSGDALDPAGGPEATDFALARLHPDGTLDPTFGGGDGVVVFRDPGNVDGATGVALQADGRIVASGLFSNENAEGDTEYSHFRVLRFNPDGSLDATWGAGGVVTTRLNDDPAATPKDSTGDVLVDGAGRITAIGTRSDPVIGTSQIALVRYNAADGSLDPAFGTGGKAFAVARRFAEVGVSGAFQPDGKVLVTGTALDFPILTRARFRGTFVTVRFNPDGTPDAGFGGGRGVYHDFSASASQLVQLAIAVTITVQPDAKILVGGLVARANVGGRATVHVALARMNPDGSPDASFGRAGLVETRSRQLAAISQILVLEDGRILCSGVSAANEAEAEAGRFSALLIQYGADGRLDRTFGRGGRVVISPPAAASGAAAVDTDLIDEAASPSPGAGFAAFADAVIAGGALPDDAPPAQAAQEAIREQAAIVIALQDRLLVVSSSDDRLTAARLISNGPDPAVASVGGARRTAAAGGNGTATVRFLNSGNEPVAGTTAVTLLLSTDAALDAGDRTVGSLTLGEPLGPRRRKTLRFRFLYPADLPAGGYFLIAVADPGAEDVLLTNNAAASRMAVAVGPP